MAIVLNKGYERAVDRSLDSDLYDIVPSDTVDLPAPIQALYVGADGDVAFVNKLDEVLVVTYVAGGPYYISGVKRINATATDATGLKGLVSKGLR